MFYQKWILKNGKELSQYTEEEYGKVLLMKQINSKKLFSKIYLQISKLKISKQMGIKQQLK